MDVTIRDAMLAEVDAGRVFENLRELGVAAIEVDVRQDFSTPSIRRKDGTPYSVEDAPAIDELKRRLSEEAVRVSALLISTDFASKEAEAHVEWAVRTVHAAAELAAPVVRIDPLAHDKSLGAGEVLVPFNRHVYTVLQRHPRPARRPGRGKPRPLRQRPPIPRPRLRRRKGRPAAGPHAGHRQFLLVRPPAGGGVSPDRGVRAAHQAHAREEHQLPAGRGAAHPLHRPGLRQVLLALDEGNLDLNSHRRRPAHVRLRPRPVHRKRIAGKYPPEEKLAVLRRDVRAVREAIGAAQFAGTPGAV